MMLAMPSGSGGGGSSVPGGAGASAGAGALRPGFVGSASAGAGAALRPPAPAAPRGVVPTAVARPPGPSGSSKKKAFTNPFLLLDPVRMSVTPALALKEPFLVPIVVDIEWMGKRYQDAFQWNVYDVMSPDEFAALTAEDLGYPSGFQALLATEIKRQLQDARGAIEALSGPPAALGGPHIPSSAPRLSKLRIEVHNNDMVLQDVLLWDVFEKHNCPDSAAATIARDLGLSYDWEPLIAVAILDQVRKAQMALRGVGPPGPEDVPHELYSEVDPECARGPQLSLRARQ